MIGLMLFAMVGVFANAGCAALSIHDQRWDLLPLNVAGALICFVFFVLAAKES